MYARARLPNHSTTYIYTKVFVVVPYSFMKFLYIYTHKDKCTSEYTQAGVFFVISSMCRNFGFTYIFDYGPSINVAVAVYRKVVLCSFHAEFPIQNG